jgi:hypothetical protein
MRESVTWQKKFVRDFRFGKGICGMGARLLIEESPHPFGFAQGRLCRSNPGSDKGGATSRVILQERAGQPPGIDDRIDARLRAYRGPAPLFRI